jgi:hypothetical protein
MCTPYIQSKYKITARYKDKKKAWLYYVFESLRHSEIMGERGGAWLTGLKCKQWGGGG